MRRQQTLAGRFVTSGRGLHSGEPARVVVEPAAPDHGIRFAHGAGAGVPAHADHAWEVAWATRLGTGADQVATVEHLLAALAALEVDNARIEVDGPEIPILDGSAQPFVELISAAGTVEQDRTVPTLRITRPVSAVEGDRFIRVEPADGLSVDYAVAFPEAAAGSQRWCGPITPAVFRSALAPARTFGFLSDATSLRRQGLARGATLDNCLVMDGERVLSAPLRFPDECVRHKVLDLVGDLALLGYPLRGRITARYAGHALHVALVRAVLSTPESWELESEPAYAALHNSPPASERLVALAG